MPRVVCHSDRHLYDMRNVRVSHLPRVFVFSCSDMNAARTFSEIPSHIIFVTLSATPKFTLVVHPTEQSCKVPDVLRTETSLVLYHLLLYYIQFAGCSTRCTNVRISTIDGQKYEFDESNILKTNHFILIVPPLWEPLIG